MTPDARKKLEQKLSGHGLSVLLTRDFDAILLQLARLAQFERLMLTAAAGNPAVEFAVDHVQREQSAFIDCDRDFTVPLAVGNIPRILQAVNIELQQRLDSASHFYPDRLNAAIVAFTAISFQD